MDELIRHSSSGSVRHGLLLDVKTDFGLWRLGWWQGHELADGVENGLELGIVFSLKVGQLASEISIREQEFAQAHERTHDSDVHLDSPGAPQDAGKHGYPLL